MSDQHGGGAPAPGWYADPTGLAGVRWWDGAQWSSYTAPMPASGTATGAGARPPLPEGAPIYTPFIWLIVLLPLLSSVAIWFYQPVLPRLTADGRPATADPAATFTPGYFVFTGFSLVIYALSVVFAYLDHRALLRIGLVRPFSWAWEFLSPLVYVIGRSVVVRSVARPRGLLPVWILIAVTVVNLVVSGIWSAVLFGQIAAQLHTLGDA